MKKVSQSTPNPACNKKLPVSELRTFTQIGSWPTSAISDKYIIKVIHGEFMAYPIFDETMVDLTWPEVEEHAKDNPPVLLPISIIEEHGPHMDLAPDVYLAHQLAKDVKKLLKEETIKALIAPPLYWGISECTESFPGTFSIRPETMIELMYDLVSCLYKWGFSRIFILNVHGDPVHIKTIIKGIQNIKCKLDLNIYLLCENEDENNNSFEGSEDYLLHHKSGIEGSDFNWSGYADIHAGGEETSSMLKDFPNSVKKDILSEMIDSNIPYDQLMDWRGDKARTMTPLGYCGNPSNFNITEVEKIDNLLAKNIAIQIIRIFNIITKA